MVVRVSDGSGNPIGGVAVTFTNATQSGVVQTLADGTAFPGRGSDASTLSLNYFHVAGTQTVVASAPGLASVSFRITVLPSTFTFDGLYECRTESGGSVDLRQMQVTGGLSQFGSATGSVDGETGAIQLTSGGGASQTHYSGQIQLEPNGQANLLGTAQNTVFGEPSGTPWQWSCSRY